ncbi:hypothetical protein SAMN05444143_1256 [Flavobacterium succinicans]|uniref:Uncharacterized protein n=1 Tax=Flavobacterium succinicans TaxID=29536 RepID=A0A1I5A511_9FLAO|nr:hypothetical protein [Flavobacterium succinicans]SFN57554.1 hypothetical protein SAMN05444143_1256 [Flavobacterium succinicans]
MASATLNRRLRKFSESLFSKYKRSNKLPSTIIGVEHHEIQAVDHSGKYPKDLCTKLETELLKIAPLGEKGIDNYVGCCCEVRASNQLILLRLSIPISDLKFTRAIRPRTGQTIKRCQNCKQVFG